MRACKRGLCLLLCLSMLPLSGCSGIYSSFREVEELLVLQTMGLDNIPGGVRLSLAAGAESSPGSAPVRLEGAGSTISMAIEQARNSSFEQELFFSNIDSLLIGEEAARLGVDNYLAYICQSPMLRIDIPLFIVRGGSARDCLLLSGDTQSSISDIVQGISDSLSTRGDNQIFSAAQVISASIRHGSALVCALELQPSSQSATGGGRGQPQSVGILPEDSSQVSQQLADSEKGGSASGGESASPSPAEDESQSGSDASGGEQGSGSDTDATASPGSGTGGTGSASDSSGSSSGSGGTGSAGEEQSDSQVGQNSQEKYTVAPAGLAVLKNNRLCAFIEAEDVLGVGFLIDDPGVSDLALKDKSGAYVSIQINEGGCRVYPVWAEDGRLLRLDISARASATVLESQGKGDLDDSEYVDELSALLESYISDRMNSVLALSTELGADFLGLGSRVEQRDAKQFRMLGRSFSSLLPALELRVSVSAQLSHANDIV